MFSQTTQRVTNNVNSALVKRHKELITKDMLLRYEKGYAYNFRKLIREMSEITEKSHGRKETHCNLFEDRSCKLRRRDDRKHDRPFRITGIEEEIRTLQVKIGIVIK